MSTSAQAKRGIRIRKDSFLGQEILIALCLLLITILSRIPFRSQVLYHWGSVNFAFAMQRFDVAAEQPQPPGYIAYVWLCRLVDLLFHDLQVTMLYSPSHLLEKSYVSNQILMLLLPPSYLCTLYL